MSDGSNGYSLKGISYLEHERVSWGQNLGQRCVASRLIVSLQAMNWTEAYAQVYVMKKHKSSAQDGTFVCSLLG